VDEVADPYAVVSSSFLGFAAERSQWFPSYNMVLIILPSWSIAAALVVLPCVWLARWRRLRIAGIRDLCPACGYDLRATPDRCPECGTAKAAA
jgi:hypothetical protein